ncbi:protein of unknown function [Geodermatophilus amargosae]|uniref:DUF4383 domain-containing protein n=1 Tax=Geodermatophilus amargosae TaxID=1296565 RepID=A0A1I6XCL2_9ACTN|nr:DUF4383 domain-containing protein [Geodermatophilus amargosae]SFT35853.1 protein of unknown function [Geodermatophilus amargosae]
MALSLHRKRTAARMPATPTSTASAPPGPPPAGAAPVDTAPAETASVDTAPVDTAPAETAPAGTEEQGPSDAGRSPGGANRVYTVQRIGAFVVAGVIAVFGVLGLLNGLAFFSTAGERVLGLSSNGLLSVISLVTAVVLVVAALRGPRVASTVMIVIGVLFLVSALANLAVLNTSWNFLAFRLSNVAFSVVAGLVLLMLGAYGRVSGNLPADSPYARDNSGDVPPVSADEYPSTPAEFAVERAMREAEVAVVQHIATFDQRRRVAAMSQVTSRKERRAIWTSFDRARRDA